MGDAGRMEGDDGIMKVKWLISLIICMSILVITPVLAETLNGTIGGSVIDTGSWSFDVTYNTASYYQYIYVNDIENSFGTIALIREDANYRPTFTSTKVAGNTTPFTATISGVEIGHGTFGYQRLYNGVGTEQNGYQFYIFDQWNVTGRSGDIMVTINMPVIDGISQPGSTGKGSAPLATGKMGLATVAGYPAGSLLYCGNYTQNKDLTTWNDYTAVKPSGLGITGTVLKSHGGLSYSSRAFVYNATTGGVITSQGAVMDTNFAFNVPSGSIIIGMKDSVGTYWNSSTLFNVTSGYNLTVAPSQIAPGGTTIATISSSTGSFSRVNAYSIACQNPDNPNVGYACTVNGTDPTWMLISGNWTQIDANKNWTLSWGASFPSSVTLEGFTAPGNVNIEATLFPSDVNALPIPRMTANLQVLGTEQYHKVYINVRDQDTAGFIYGATAAVKGVNWSNQTVTNGPAIYNIQHGAIVGHTATAAGYDPASVYYTQITADKTIDIVLSKTRSYATNVTGLRAYVVTTGTGQWISLDGATVTLSDGQTRLTPGSGLAEFTVNTNTTYGVTATKAGYGTLTRSVAVGTEPVSVSLELGTVTATPTVTTTTGPQGGTGPNGEVTYHDVAQQNLDTLMMWGGRLFLIILLILLAAMIKKGIFK